MFDTPVLDDSSKTGVPKLGYMHPQGYICTLQGVHLHASGGTFGLKETITCTIHGVVICTQIALFSFSLC